MYGNVKRNYKILNNSHLNLSMSLPEQRVERATLTSNTTTLPLCSLKYKRHKNVYKCIFQIRANIIHVNIFVELNFA